MARKKKRPAIQHAEIVRRFGERLREVRRSKGFTQADVARQSATSESYIRRLEAAGAAPGLDVVDRLATALGVPLTDLLPAAAPPDDLEVLREQARRQVESLVQTQDRQSLLLLVQILARLSETTPRQS